MEEDRLEAEEAQKRVEADLVMEEGRASAMRGWFETLRPAPAATVDDKKNEDGEAQNENENDNDASNEEVSTREQDRRDDETPKLVCSTRGGGPACGIPRRKTTDGVLAVVVDPATSDSLPKTRRSEGGGGLTRRRRWSTSQL
jgi:cysteine synthase